MAQRYCFAPNCHSGYKKNRVKVSMFQVPKDKLQEWSAVIPRSDKQLTLNDVLCEKHFFKEDVIREIVTETYSYPLKIPRLSENAIPSIWPNCPGYLSKKQVKNASDTNKDLLVLDRPLITEVPDALLTSQDYIEDNIIKIEEGIDVEDNIIKIGEGIHPEDNIIKIEEGIEAQDDISIKTEEGIDVQDDQSWLHSLYNKLWENKITLPSESWTIKFHDNIIAIFETAAVSANADDIVIKKKIVFSQSFLNFFIFQHLHEHLTEHSHKIDDIADFENKLIYFDELSICYGLKIDDSFPDNFNKTLTFYHQDEFSKSIRHKNCKYLLSAEDCLRKNAHYCLLCQNAKKAIRYSKIKAAKTTMSRNGLFKKNTINCRKSEQRLKLAVNQVRKELREVKEKIKSANKRKVQKNIDQMDNLPAS